MTEKNETENTPAVSSNPAKVNWPQDPHGTCAELRSAIRVTGSRVGSSRAKLERAIATIDLAKKHLVERYKRQCKAATRRLQRAEERRASEQALQNERRLREIAEYEARIAEYAEKKAALEAETGEAE